MLLFFCLLLLFASLLVLYLRKCHRFWKNRGVTSTSPNLLFGDLTDTVLGRKNIILQYRDIYDAFPNERFVGLYEFTKPNLMIRDPRLIESILVKDFSSFNDRLWIEKIPDKRLSKHLFFVRGKQWKDLRCKLVTTFSTNKLKLMLPLMNRCADILDQLISEKCDDECVDTKEVISRFATDVIGCCIFGLQFNTLKEPESEYRQVGKIIFNPNLKSFAVSFLRLLLPKVTAFFRLSEFPSKIFHFFDNLLEQSENFRRKEDFRRNDMMQLILDIRDRDLEQFKTGKRENEGIMDDDAVLSNIFLFYAAGFETTASTLSYCLYELALHPEIQQQLREEIQTVLQGHEGDLTYDILKRMTYMEMVISETLRKYPPAGALMRACNSPYRIPGSSHTLFPADRVVIPVYALHHDEKHYPNPSEFDPERFTPENIAARKPFTYLPFGDGPRICLAIRFAKLEMKLCVARIFSKYEINTCAKTEIPMQVHPRSSLLASKNGIHLKLKKFSLSEKKC